MLRGAAGVAGGEVIEDGGDVLGIDRLAHREAALGALHRELDHLGRIVPHERLGELLHGVGIVAQLDEAVARLEARLRFLARSRELLRDLAVGRDGFRMVAGEMEGRSREQRAGRRERRAGPAAAPRAAKYSPRSARARAIFSCAASAPA